MTPKHSILSLLAFLAATCAPALAGEHPLTRITGTEIDLKAYDHAIAGSIRDFVIFGNKSEEAFESELLMKKDGQVIRAIFSKNEAFIGGTIQHEKDGRSFVTRLELAGIDQEQRVINVRVSTAGVALDIPVRIESDGFEDGHFINPAYSATINGRSFGFKLENGHACYGFSTHLIFMILGAYVHGA